MERERRLKNTGYKCNVSVKDDGQRDGSGIEGNGGSGGVGEKVKMTVKEMEKK